MFKPPRQAKPIPIEIYEKKLPEGKWSHTSIFSALYAAYEWKIRPSELGICAPEEDIIYMVAYLHTHSLMERIEYDNRE